MSKSNFSAKCFEIHAKLLVIETIQYVLCKLNIRFDFVRGANESSREVMVNGEVKSSNSSSSSTTPIVSITNPSIDTTCPSNATGGKQAINVSIL